VRGDACGVAYENATPLITSLVAGTSRVHCWTRRSQALVDK